MRNGCLGHRIAVVGVLTALVSLCCSCGRIRYERVAKDAEALDGDGRSTDGGVRCQGTFGAPSLVPNVNDPSALDDDPGVSADGLELFFKSDRPGSAQTDVWVSTRSDRSQRWTSPRRVAELNEAGVDKSPSLSADLLTIWLSSNRTGSQGDDIYVSTRDDRTAMWSMPALVPGVNSSAHDRGPTTYLNGLGMIMQSARTGGEGGFDLYQFVRASRSDSWQQGISLDVINQSFDESAPEAGPQGLVLYYHSGMGSDADIYRASRAATDVTFNSPVRVAEISSPSSERDPTLTEDGCYIVFASNRSGNMELWHATRSQ